MSKTHKFPVRIYYEDTDTAGIVYHANYLKFAERARTEFLREAGIEQSELFAKHKIGFVVRRCEVDFLVGAKLDDLLIVESKVIEMKNASLTMEQKIYVDSANLSSCGEQSDSTGSIAAIKDPVQPNGSQGEYMDEYMDEYMGKKLLVKILVKLAVVGEGLKPARIPSFIKDAILS